MPDWQGLLASADEGPHDKPVRAETFVKKFSTSSQPVVLQCDDGHDYVVKSKHAGRMIVTDQIVGRVGRSAQAPVPEVALVDVPAEMIQAEPEMGHMSPGVAHGSKWVSNCTEQQGFEHTNVPENRDRFARIALLYGWVVASDHQFIYEKDPPRLVHSVDHGHFFAGSNGWTVDTLRQAPAPAIDTAVVNACSLTDSELDAAKTSMTRVADEEIAVAVTYPLDDWGLSGEERIAVAEYLATRRDVIFGVADEEDAGAI
jgi:hypothetical protein